MGVSPGSDGITNEVIIRLWLFRGFINGDDLPEDWKIQNIMMLAKPGGKGYRPVALAQSLLKILESLVKIRLDWFDDPGEPIWI